jgi:nicotinate-nucleotide adenylyltransferase
VVTGLLGGAFDPPHNGHVELAHRALERFELDPLVVLVAARPGHKHVVLDAAFRFELARAAFPGADVRLDEHARTVDMLRDSDWDDPLFLIGADEFCDFLTWKEPDSVLDLTRLAVAARPGFPRERLETVLRRLRRPDRVEFFEIDPWPVASRELRARLIAGEPVDDVVPPAVARLIAERSLYRA